ncbi:MAG: fructose bisphosphate aldolase [Nevskia sp.]|nr:fructose bisphosphate aldolase [Nevskia sp.]
MNLKTLHETALAMVAPGKGILAADESTGTIKKRFDQIGIENTWAHRRAYRDMLFTTPDFEKYTSGVILFEETLFDKGLDDTPFPKLLAARGVIPGIKVDQGAKPLAGGVAEETVTEGLDGLRERLEKYRAAGARFAKWRAVITIGEDSPTDYAIHVNAHALARYAALCQEADIVPIVEPEVLMDGDNDIETCEDVTDVVLAAVFGELYAQRVVLEGIILKPNMVVSGAGCSDQACIEEVAERTLRVLRRHVPAAVPGIAFLSGGQSDELATAHLDAMNKAGPLPWGLTFSYGRALQAAALKAWSGKNVDAGKAAHQHRAKMNSLAALGKWDQSLERAA